MENGNRLPELTDEQRKAALARAAQARRERTEFMDKMIAGAEMEAYIAGILAALFFILSEISELKYEL